MTLIYAHDFYLDSVKTKTNIVQEIKGNSMQTVEGENVAVSMYAMSNKKEILYTVSITNKKTEQPYYFDESYLKVFMGNYETDKWEVVDHKKALAYFRDKKAEIKRNEFMQAFTLALSSVSAGYSKSSGNIYTRNRTYTYTMTTYNYGNAAIASAYSSMVMDRMYEKDADYLSFLQENLLYSYEIPKSTVYNGIFFAAAKNAPDYKVVYNDGTDRLEFIFSRSDRFEVLHPWHDKSWNRHAVLAGTNIFLNRYDVMYNFMRPKGVGFYGGMSVYLPRIENTTKISYISCSEMGDPDPNDKYDWVYYDWKFEKGDSFDYSALSLAAGITIKTIPNTWILLGCGLDMCITEYSKGDMYYKLDKYSSTPSDWQYYDTRWGEERARGVKFAPQVGVGVITNHLALNGLFSYAIKGKWSFDILAGWAF